jgi:hypothetical protein
MTSLTLAKGPISDNVPGLPTCRASGMSAGPGASEVRPLPFPGGRAAASGASGNPFVIWSAPRCVRTQARAPVPGLLPHQLPHTVRERAPRNNRIRFLTPEARRLASRESMGPR